MPLRRDLRAVTGFAVLALGTVTIAFFAAEASRTPPPPPTNIPPVWMDPYGYLPRFTSPEPEISCDAEPHDVCWGRYLHEQAGCKSCHSTDPTVQEPGPSFAHSFGTVRRLEGGRTVVVDAEYIARAIRHPAEEIALGYTTTEMNPYRLSDQQVRAIVAFIESLAVPPPPPEPPARVRRGRVR